MSKQPKIKSFDVIGWGDPFSNNPVKAKEWLYSLSFDAFVYPKDYIKPENPPMCIFVPEKTLVEKMVKTVMKYSWSGRRVMLAKFFDLELEKHAYMTSNADSNSNAPSMERVNTINDHDEAIQRTGTKLFNIV